MAAILRVRDDNGNIIDIPAIAGKDGKKGEDGYTPIKGVDYFDGDKGEQGIQGPKGNDGYTPVKGVDYFDGVDGTDGTNGYTPIRGTDYWTEADQTAIVADVLAALPNGDGVSY